MGDVVVVKNLSQVTWLLLPLIALTISRSTTSAMAAGVPTPSTQYKFQVPNQNSQLSLLDLAIQITDFARSASNPEPFVCTTWIFASDTLEDGQQVSNSLSQATFDQLYPIVLVSQEEDGACDNETSTSSVNSITSRTNKTRRFTYTNYEFSEDDIFRPQHLGIMRKSVNCMSVFILGDNEQVFSAITNKIIEKKLARPHRDYFFYFVGISDLTEAGDGHQTEVKNLMGINQVVSELRYKFVLDLKGKEMTSETLKVVADFYNVCERKGEKLQLFSKTCNSHIIDRHYKITSCYIAPMVRYSNNPDGSRKWGSGMIYSMFLEASKRYNFTFDIRYAGFSGSSGFKTKDGQWFGAVGEVFKREADIAFSVGIVAYRHHVVDPSMTQCWITRTFFIKEPSFRISWQSMFWPMKLHIWVLTILTIFIAIPVYYWAAIVYFNTDISAAGSRPLHLLTDVIDVLNRILMEQSATARPWKGNRIRLLILLWTGFCLVLETGYRSKLVTFLTFLEREDIPKTHMELSKSDYKLFFRTYNGVAYQYTLASPDPMHKRILAKSTLSNHSHECIHLALLTEKSACLDYRLNGQFAIETNATLYLTQKSEVMTVSKDDDFTTNIVWAFRKGSPWTASYDKVILNQLAAGLYNKFKDDDWTQSRIQGSQYLRSLKESPVRDKIQSVMTDMDTGPKPLNRVSLNGTFLVLIVGVFVSFVSWVGEHISFKCESYKSSFQKRRQVQKIVKVNLEMQTVIVTQK